MAVARIDVRYVDVKVLDNLIELLDYYSNVYGITYTIRQRADGFHNDANEHDIIENVTALKVVVRDYCGAYLPLNKLKMINVCIYVIPLAQTDENNHAPNENISLDNVIYGINIIKTILTCKS